MNRKRVWNTGRLYREEGQVIFAELGWYPPRPNLVAMYDRCRGICYVYDFSFMLEFIDSDHGLKRHIMNCYDHNLPEAEVDDSDREYYPALNAWRNMVVGIPKSKWPGVNDCTLHIWEHHCTVLEQGSCDVCGAWMDPAGGTHSADDDPAAMYE